MPLNDIFPSGAKCCCHFLHSVFDLLSLKVSAQDLVFLKKARKSHWRNLAFHSPLQRILTALGLP